jgi:hypothetical protein
VFEKLNEVCAPFGNVPASLANQVGKVPKSKVGDIVVRLNHEFTRGVLVNIVIEAKDAGSYTPQKVVTELREAQQNRDATIAIMVFHPVQCPAACQPLHQYDNDKIVCSYDPDNDSDKCLQLAYRLARIEALRRLRDVGPEIDTEKLQSLVSQCRLKLTTITAIKAKVTRYANEINRDMDSLNDDLANLFLELDNISQAAAA